MQLVIDIPDGIYNKYMDDRTHVTDVLHAVRCGTPLPKGHGDLIDRKDLIENGISKGFCNWYDEIKMADTIIPADRGE